MSGTTSENTSQFTTATTSGVQNKKTSTTISTKTTSYLRKTSGSDKENQDGSDNEKTSLVIPLLTAAVVLLCLLLAGVAIAIICKRRNRYALFNSMSSERRNSRLISVGLLHQQDHKFRRFIQD